LASKVDVDRTGILARRKSTRCPDVAQANVRGLVALRGASSTRIRTVLDSKSYLATRPLRITRRRNWKKAFGAHKNAAELCEWLIDKPIDLDRISSMRSFRQFHERLSDVLDQVAAA
jgi:hypothetical protein